MTEFVILGRGEGKTSYMIDWVLESRSHHLFVPTLRERNDVVNRLCDIRPETGHQHWMSQVRDVPDDSRQLMSMVARITRTDRQAVFGFDDIERVLNVWMSGMWHFAIISGTHTDRPGIEEPPPDGDNDPPHDGSFALSA